MTRAEQLIAAVQQSGFPHLDSLIHLFVGGSELHGAKVKDTDDLDIYGVYLEPPELVLGLEKQDFYVWSTAGDERRNTADDTDVCLYSFALSDDAAKSPLVLEPNVDQEKIPGPSGPLIRCPLCRWTPRTEDRWSCSCGHEWNTFDTGGICPACLHQWSTTQCLSCKGWSPHSDWYAE